jgi:glutamate-1-semialdehyde 2,1-aminomutase
MISPKWFCGDEDNHFFDVELDAFVPERIFDAHMHLGNRSGYTSNTHNAMVANTPEVADMASYREHLPWILPKRNVTGANVLPSTISGDDREEGTAFAAKEAATEDVSGSSVVVHPAMSADQLRAEIEQFNPVSLKPYHMMAPRPDTQQSTIEEYLPENLVAVAHEAKLPVVVHLVRDKALADEGNQKTIRHYCTTYPDMQLVLAHCARGLNPGHTARGIGAIAGLDNVFFDTSCACESGSMVAILKTFGHTKMMWGSDWPFSHFHGKCIAIGDFFSWIFDDQLAFAEHTVGMTQGFTFVSHESIRAIKMACHACDMSKAQVEAIFHDNAAQLFARR